MATPTPVFPGAIVTDQQLKVANNLIETKLKVGIDASNTILFVDSTAGFRANMLISVDKEILAIESVTGAPNPTLVVATGGRGFDGTSAAMHAAGARVAVLIDAWHHNVLATELKAIQNFLGPNGQNLSSSILLSSLYNFPAQSPGGPLAPGNNVITLAPVPAGVNGSDQHHYLYISGGTGSPEAVLITGGTAVSGAASGTVIVNCANAHIGAWTIASATSGIQEAVNVGSASGFPNSLVHLPAGTLPVHATIRIQNSGICIQGESGSSTVVNQLTPNITTILIQADSGQIGANNLQDFVIQDNVSNAAGGILVEINNSIRTMLFRMVLIAGYTGLHCTNNSGQSMVFACNFYNQINTMILLETTGGIFIGNTMFGGTGTVPSAGIYASMNNGLSMYDCDFWRCGTAVIINPGNGQYVVNWFVDSVSFDTGTRGMLINGSGTGYVQALHFVNCWSATNSGEGVVLDFTGGGRLSGFSWNSGSIHNNGTGGLIVRGIPANMSDIRVADSDIGANSVANVNTYGGISVDVGIGDVQILGNRIGSPVYGITNSQLTGLTFTAGTGDGIIVQGNRFLGDNNALSFGATGIHNIVKDNIGVDDVVRTIASAASIALPPGSLFTISGTTPIATISGGAIGRRVKLVFTDASPGGLVTGGNIARTQTAVQNQGIILDFNGTLWY